MKREIKSVEVHYKISMDEIMQKFSINPNGEYIDTVIDGDYIVIKQIEAVNQ